MLYKLIFFDLTRIKLAELLGILVIA